MIVQALWRKVFETTLRRIPRNSVEVSQRQAPEEYGSFLQRMKAKFRGKVFCVFLRFVILIRSYPKASSIALMSAHFSGGMSRLNPLRSRLNPWRPRHESEFTPSLAEENNGCYWKDEDGYYHLIRRYESIPRGQRLK